MTLSLSYFVQGYLSTSVPLQELLQWYCSFSFHFFKGRRMKLPKWHFIFNLFFCRRILTDSLLLSATDQVCGARFHMSVVLYLPFSLLLSLFFFFYFSLYTTFASLYGTMYWLALPGVDGFQILTYDRSIISSVWLVHNELQSNNTPSIDTSLVSQNSRIYKCTGMKPPWKCLILVK